MNGSVSATRASEREGSSANLKDITISGLDNYSGISVDLLAREGLQDGLLFRVRVRYTQI